MERFVFSEWLRGKATNALSEHMADESKKERVRIPLKNANSRQFLTFLEKSGHRGEGERRCVVSFDDIVKSSSHLRVILSDDEKMARSRQLVMLPFENDMDALVKSGILASWDYCHQDGGPLSEDEESVRSDFNGNPAALPYCKASGLCIQYDWAVG